MAVDVLPDQLARVQCVECKREWTAGELWHLRFADLREVAIYCPVCAAREFDG